MSIKIPTQAERDAEIEKEKELEKVELSVKKRQEVRDCKKYAMTQVTRNLYKMYFEEQVKEDIKLFTDDEDLIKCYNWALEKKKSRENNFTYFWVTVNIDKKHTLEDLQKKIEKCLSKGWIDSYIYNIEARWKDENNDKNRGIHCHMIIDRNDQEKERGKNQIRNTFKTLVEIPLKHIHIKAVNENYGQNCINYIKGNKVPEKKKKTVELDKEWRKRIGIKDYYSHKI